MTIDIDTARCTARDARKEIRAYEDYEINRVLGSLSVKEWAGAAIKCAAKKGFDYCVLSKLPDIEAHIVLRHVEAAFPDFKVEVLHRMASLNMVQIVWEENE